VGVIKGEIGEVRATVQVRRAATGLVETYELVGNTTPEQHAAIMAELGRPKVHGASGSVAGAGSALGAAKPTNQKE
jgi:hypothetical protein